MDEIGKMRRDHAREGRSIKGIDRGMSVSCAAVRKVLRSAATEFDYALGLGGGTGCRPIASCRTASAGRSTRSRFPRPTAAR